LNSASKVSQGESGPGMCSYEKVEARSGRVKGVKDVRSGQVKRGHSPLKKEHEALGCFQARARSELRYQSLGFLSAAGNHWFEGGKNIGVSFFRIPSSTKKQKKKRKKLKRGEK